MALAATWVTTDALASTYVFENIADTTGSFADFQDVALNDSNQVAFQATSDDTSTGVFRWDGGALTTIAESGPVFTEIFTGRRISINSSGEVAFLADLVGGGGGVFRGSGGAVTTIADTITDLTGTNAGSSTSINDAGFVAFSGAIVGITNILIGDGGALSSIAHVGAEYNFVGGRPQINNQGVVSFFGTPAGHDTGVFLSDGTTNTEIADISGIAAGFLLNGGLNDNGVASFVALADGSFERRIYIGNGGPLTEVAKVADGFSSLSVPDINNNGQLAFGAGIGALGNGIFTGSDPVADRVVGTGDALFGFNVSTIFFTVGGLNNNGDIAFSYRLTNGGEGVAIARHIPEPSSLLLTVTVAIGIAVRRRRSRVD